MISALISRLVILGLGTLYPAYASYKAVRTKDVKEYVKWMMYWIVFALFTCAETFTDVLLSFWFPFYYEIKVCLVLWLLSPATKGSSFLYKTFVHPAFLKRENEIDDMIVKAKERGYSTVLRLGSQGVTYATNVILQTAMKGGGGLVEHLRKSYSLSDLGPKNERFLLKDEADSAKGDDFVGEGIHFLRRMLSAPPEAYAPYTSYYPGQVARYYDGYNLISVIEEDEDVVVSPRPGLRRRPAEPTGVDMRFKEIDVNVRQFHSTNANLGRDIQSTEDISSGYSSTDQLFPGQSEQALNRTGSVTSRGRGRVTRASQAKRSPLTEDTDGGEEGGLSSESSLTLFYDSCPSPDPSELEFQTSLTPYKSFNRSLTDINNQSPIERFSDACLLLPPEIKNDGSQSSLSSFSSDKSERKGKYKKLPAPKPPVNVPAPQDQETNDKRLESTV